VLCALALAATGALSDDGGDGGGGGTAPAPDGGSSVTLTSIPVDSPAGIAIGDGQVVVASYERDRVTSLDLETAAPGRPVDAGEGPSALAFAGGSLWVAQTDVGRIARIDAGERRVVGNPVEFPAADGDSLEAGEGAVWAADSGEGTVGRIDPATGKLAARVRVPGGVSGDLAAGAGAVWAVNAEQATVTRIDPATNRVAGEPIEVGESFEDAFDGAVAVGEGAVWASSPEDDTVVRIDPASGEVTRTVRVPSGVGNYDLAVGLGRVWLFDDESELVPIDPASGRVGERVPAGLTGGDEMEIAGGAIWMVGNTDADRVARVVPPADE
jgi:virginiamycin B lyase